MVADATTGHSAQEIVCVRNKTKRRRLVRFEVGARRYGFRTIRTLSMRIRDQNANPDVPKSVVVRRTEAGFFMQVTVVSLGHRVDVDVAIRGGDVTIGDVVEATMGGPQPEYVAVDGRSVPARTLVDDCELLRGSVIDATPGPRGGLAKSRGTVTLCQTGGIDAGWMQSLETGTHRLGQIGRRHGVPFDLERTVATITVGSNATVIVSPDLDGAYLDDVELVEPTEWTDQTLFVAGRLFRIDRTPSLRLVTTPTRSGFRAVVRPARTRPPLDPGVIVVPELELTRAKPRKLPIVSLLAPLPVAALMSFVLGPRALLFGLLTPVMTLATWFEDKRQQRLDKRADATATIKAEASVRAEIQRWLETETRRRRDVHPNPSEIVTRALTRSPRLWERRLDHEDALLVSIGSADQPGDFQFSGQEKSKIDLAAIAESSPQLSLASVAVSLRDQSGMGFAGEHDVAVAAAWGILSQLTVLHGPADIQIAVFTSESRLSNWEDLKWIPHALDATGNVRIVTTVEEGHELARSIAGAEGNDKPGTISFGRDKQKTTSPVWVIVTDEPSHYRGRSAPLRKILSDAAPTTKVLVLADSADDLPAVCTAFVESRRLRSRTDGGRAERAPVVATLTIPSQRWSCDRVILDGLGSLTVGSLARALASAEDPEHVVGSSSGLPLRVSLPPLLGLHSWTQKHDPTSGSGVDAAMAYVSEALMQRWRSFAVVRPVAPLGVSLDGVIELDLVADGPHGLIAGTTGSGKSELLRTMVCGLATVVPPDQLQFLLVDYKGGSAFDACSFLPHVVGMVTDLDEHLGTRVLQSLQAEIRHRERVLRTLEATDLDEVLAQAQKAGERSPLARLVIVVDEFATLASELPDFLPSLVDVAQRGRSLGMHLILATQRPAGVLDNKIRANTNLRIALRVQDDNDSVDVIGVRSAAAIERGRAGRGIIRRGAGELMEFHAARVTKPFSDGTQERNVEVRPFTVIADSTVDAPDPAVTTIGSGVTDLTVLVDAITRASAALGFAEQRRPFLEALPEVLHWNDERLLSEDAGAGERPGYVVGLADEPNEQRQSPLRVELGPGMNLVAFGVAGSGTTTFLRGLIRSVVASESPNNVHLYVIDADSGALQFTDQLPHTGGTAGLEDLAQVARLLRVLMRELEGRRSRHSLLNESPPTILLVIDNLGALRQGLQDDPQYEGTLGLLDALARDGSSLGINIVATATAERGVGSALLTAMPQRLVFRLADTAAFLSFGIRPRDVPDLSAGRCLLARPSGAIEIQIGLTADSDFAAVRNKWSNEPVTRRPLPVPVIRSQINRHDLRDLPVDAVSSVRSFAVPIGVDLTSGCLRQLAIAPGEHTLLLGPPRSGKSSLARVIVDALSSSSAPPRISILSPRPSPLRNVEPTAAWVVTNLEDLETWERVITENGGRRVVVIDDADRLSTPILERLATRVDDDLSLVVIARTEAMRGFGFWAKPLAASRNGIILKPKSGDGECLRTTFPSRLPVLQSADAALVDDGTVYLVRTVWEPTPAGL
jgi:DNA segregation ATPase FtsK/SpoIIIE, S-DNA-T family